MKSLIVDLPDDVYDRAEHKAAERGATLTGEVVDLIRRYSDGVEFGNGAPAASSDVEQLFSALDAGRNSVPLGRLRRDELYDRRVVH